MKADLIAYDKNGQLTLIAEVKNKLGTSRNWAASMRRNMLAHGLLPSTRFFLLALPNRFYLWKDAPNGPEVIPPDYEIDPTSFLGPYYKRLGVPLENLSGASFELVVTSWLSNIQTSRPDVTAQGLEWLEKSGLLDAIAEGSVVVEATV